LQLTFSPQAVRKILSIINDKGGGLAVRIRIRRSEWKVTLERATTEALLIDGISVLADEQTMEQLDGLMIDWLQTPDGPGFGVMDRKVQTRDLRLGAD
jgi:Fe-S cluster assembly iron-binding protein IscA